MKSRLRFPSPFKHTHPPIQDLNEILEERSGLSQRAADQVAKIVGSWRFILIQSGLLVIWVILNVTAIIHHWDPYPFILMNLVMSLQAAFTAPIIMMSQNRQSERDRLEARLDYAINIKAEIEVQAILEHLAAQDKALQEIYATIVSLHGVTELEEGAVD